MKEKQKETLTDKVVKSFLITFVVLTIILAVLYFGFGIDLIRWYDQFLLAIILFGVPTLVYFKNREK